MTDRTLTEKSAAARGRKTAVKPGPVHVETLPCPAGGLHVIVWKRGETVCAGCSTTWADLDHAARNAPAPELPKSGECPCGVWLIAHGVWNDADEPQRKAWNRAGGRKRHSADRCTTCYRREFKAQRRAGRAL